MFLPVKGPRGTVLHASAPRKRVLQFQGDPQSNTLLMAPDRSSPPLILLVDDYEDARVMYGHFLRMSGFEPLEASTGEEALELAYARLPDLILLDMSLPGIDGWEVTAQLKRSATTKHIPIVALTAHALQSERLRTERAGCDGFLAKPCAPPDLLAEITRLLGPKANTGPSR